MYAGTRVKSQDFRITNYFFLFSANKLPFPCPTEIMFLNMFLTLGVLVDPDGRLDLQGQEGVVRIDR